VTLNVGVLYVFAMLSLGVYGVMMAGWSSANNYALLGGPARRRPHDHGRDRHRRLDHGRRECGTAR